MKFLERFFRPTIYLNTRECKIALISGLADEMAKDLAGGRYGEHGEKSHGVIWLRKKLTTEQLKKERNYVSD